MLRFTTVLGLMVLVTGTARAGVPKEISHQGVVSVSGVRFDGWGFFRFAIVDLDDNGKNLWTNDGMHVGVIGMPESDVRLKVDSGVYSVRLGDTELTNMGVIPPAIFSHGNTALRIWFDDDTNGAEQLIPDHKIAASPYTHRTENGVPVGAIIAIGGAAAPDGWVLCDGSEVSRTTYAALLSAIGTNWGAGDGSTTFNLPDMRGRFLRGVDAGAERDPDAGTRAISNSGGSVGDAVGSAQADATGLPNAGFGTSDTGAHQHPESTANTDYPFGEGPTLNGIALPGSFVVGPGVTSLTRSAGSHSHTVTGGDAETRPENVYVNFIIKY